MDNVKTMMSGTTVNLEKKCVSLVFAISRLVSDAKLKLAIISAATLNV